MNPFKNMDLYKGIILASLVLLPVTGFWCQSLSRRIAEADVAIRDATRPGTGTLERIGALQKQVETVEANRLINIDAVQSHRQYFERQILKSVKGSLERDLYDFRDREEPAHTGSRNQRATDHVVEIDWGKPGAARKDFKPRLDLVFNVIFNIESAAKRGDEAGDLPSVWKLRKLVLDNATGDRLASGNKTPPPELEDAWTIGSMEFVRREPKKDAK